MEGAAPTTRVAPITENSPFTLRAPIQPSPDEQRQNVENRLSKLVTDERCLNRIVHNIDRIEIGENLGHMVETYSSLGRYLAALTIHGLIHDLSVRGGETLNTTDDLALSQTEHPSAPSRALRLFLGQSPEQETPEAAPSVDVEQFNLAAIGIARWGMYAPIVKRINEHNIGLRFELKSEPRLKEQEREFFWHHGYPDKIDLAEDFYGRLIKLAATTFEDQFEISRGWTLAGGGVIDCVKKGPDNTAQQLKKHFHDLCVEPPTTGRPGDEPGIDQRQRAIPMAIGDSAVQSDWSVMRYVMAELGGIAVEIGKTKLATCATDGDLHPVRPEWYYIPLQSAEEAANLIYLIKKRKNLSSEPRL